MPRPRKFETFVIFSDDTRHEIGNKRTIVGVYGTQMFVQSIPTVVPKFVANVVVVLHYKEPFSFLKCRLEYDHHSLAEISIKPDELRAVLANSDMELSDEVIEFPTDDPPKNRLLLELAISPFVIENEGRLVCLVETDEGIARAGSLKILQVGPSATAAPSSLPPTSEV